MTERETIDYRCFREISHSLFDIERERDLEKKVERLEQLGSNVEFLLRVMPSLGDKALAVEIDGINRRIELTRDLIERIYGDQDS